MKSISSQMLFNYSKPTESWIIRKRNANHIAWATEVIRPDSIWSPQSKNKALLWTSGQANVPITGYWAALIHSFEGFPWSMVVYEIRLASNTWSVYSILYSSVVTCIPYTCASSLGVGGRQGAPQQHLTVE